MPMNSSLTSALSEFTKKSEFSKSPLATEPSETSPLQPAVRNLIMRMRSLFGKFMPFAFVRFLMSFLVGVAATLAWQSYGSAARTTIAGWSPHLGWLAPAAVPAGASPERLKGASAALAAVRQSVDKLATEMSKLQAQGASEKTSSSPPSRPGSRRL
jgi:hypothetical protein